MLMNLRLTPLKPTELSPQGWLRNQLRIQANGLSGHLDLVWPDIADSQWIGGQREGWERVPYWLDGFIPLAYLLRDEALIARAKRYVDAILDRQCEDGWICPCAEAERPRYDIWAAFLILKVLVLYADCAGDQRIEGAVYRALKQLHHHIGPTTLFGWGAARWYECLIPLFWLYERRPEPWMIEMAHMLDAGGIDYAKLYDRLPMSRPEPARYWTFIHHVVNTGMAFKARALMARLTGEDGNAQAKHMHDKVMHFHSMASGHFTGDECLSGDSPIQGSELCSVVEAMYSYEQLMSLTADPHWGDLLERCAFNALPATISEDMWAHQYVQMSNQISATPIPQHRVHFNSNNGEAHNFGLEPNFGCCTANFHQGFPKFACSLLYRAPDGVAVGAYAPVEGVFHIDGAAVTVRIRTDYPFRDGVRVVVEADRPVEFSLQLRIPGFARGARVDETPAAPGSFFALRRLWQGASSVDVAFDFAPEMVPRPSGLYAVNRGPLLFALPIRERWERREYERDGVPRKHPYCDYLVTPESDWNYGFADTALTVDEAPVSDVPFSSTAAPMRIRASMAHVPWDSADGVCAPMPGNEGRSLDAPRPVWLQPYGCTRLRMTEMPLLRG